MTDLLPCPFCGGEPAYYASQEAVFRAHWVGHVYHCTKCQGRVQNTDRMKAQEMWNSRSPSVAQAVVMPAKLTGELACIIECCDPPEHQTDEAVERLIFDYQPMWDRLRSALSPPSANEGDDAKSASLVSPAEGK